LLSLNSEGRSVLPLTKKHSSREPKQKDTQSNFSQKRHFDLRDEGLKIKEAARKTLSEWSASELDIRQDPLFQLKPVRFKKKIQTSEIDNILYGSK